MFVDLENLKPSPVSVADFRPRGTVGLTIDFVLDCDAMSPRFERGFILTASERRPAIGDDVVVLRKSCEGGMVRRLIGTDGLKFRLQQFNPWREFDLPIEDVAGIFPIVFAGPGC